LVLNRLPALLPVPSESRTIFFGIDPSPSPQSAT
jgi:hypothetical protein